MCLRVNLYEKVWLALLINVYILFPLKSGFTNMFLVKVFRAHQRQPVSIRLINVDVTPERRSAKICLDEAVQYGLPYKMKILIFQVKWRVLENEVVHCAIVLIQGYLIQIPSSYPGYWSNLQTRFLIWNNYTVNCILVKDKKYPE